MATGGAAPRPEDMLRILIATDNHLGYADKQPEKEDDSFDTFEEIMQIAKREDVDFVLLGGDLFHENKPTRQSELKAFQILRDHVYGDRPVSFSLVSDPKVNFGHCTGRKDVNYTDPNLNIGMPIFSIHGNHDDPIGLGGYSVLDKLHAAGLVNYFGKHTDLKKVEVSPLLLTKGVTRMAIYGMSSIKDERLHRLFREGRVKMYQPEEETSTWFNMLVLHQNRAPHVGSTNFIPEHFIEGFFNLVMWGHEHECRLTAEKSVHGENKSFHITQPGSSVATSCHEGETKQKRVGILHVHKQQFKITEVELKTVRPMIFRNISLEAEIPEILSILKDQTRDKEICSWLTDYVHDLIDNEVPKLITGHPKQPQKPIIRVRVEYKDEKYLQQPVKLAAPFTDKVANYRELFLFRKISVKKEKNKIAIDNKALDELKPEMMTVSMVDLVAKYFEKTSGNKADLKALGVRGIGDAVIKYGEKDDRDALTAVVRKQTKKASPI